MLSLDDYFMVEVEKKETDPDTGKKVTRKVGRCLGGEIKGGSFHSVRCRGRSLPLLVSFPQWWWWAAR